MPVPKNVKVPVKSAEFENNRARIGHDPGIAIAAGMIVAKNQSIDTSGATIVGTG